MRVEINPDAESNAAALAANIAARLSRRLQAADRASLAMSGGGTPRRLIELLARCEIEWSRIDVFQVDERVAPDGDPARNANDLAPFTAAGAAVHAMPVVTDDLAAAATAYGESLPTMIDVVHLGLGTDGHTASWPMGDPLLDSRRPCEITSGSFNGFVRMTLTPKAVNSARVRIIQVEGSAKATIAAAIVSGKVVDYACRYLRHRGSYVVMDRAAAQRLPHSLPRPSHWRHTA